MQSGGGWGCPGAWQCQGRAMAAPAPGPAQPAQEPRAVPASSRPLTGVGWDPISDGPGASPQPLHAVHLGRALVLGR